MDKIWGELQDAIIKALENKNKTPLTEENLKISQEFHNNKKRELRRENL